MTNSSPTRRQLEESIRAILPSSNALASLDSAEKPTVASVGVGAILTGYLWGRLRGRQVRKRKRS